MTGKGAICSCGFSEIFIVGLENLIDTEELALMEGAGVEVASVFAITKATALAYLMFNLYTPPCFAALGAGFLGGLIAVAAVIAVVVCLIQKTNKNMAAEYALSGKK